MRFLKLGACGAMLTAAVALAGCETAMPNTTAAYREGGLGAAIATFAAEAQVVVVTTCHLLDGRALASTIDLGAAVADRSDLVEVVRAERQAWCEAVGGTQVVEVREAAGTVEE
ncbi:MAG TPA: hypothetical protein VFJ13_07790 [Paracoccaceae bacterium]|nr:hypothetical protein [Paracoccaceae bacterium]